MSSPSPAAPSVGPGSDRPATVAPEPEPVRRPSGPVPATLALTLACLLGAPSARAVEPADWAPCAEAVAWLHAADVPNTEESLGELLMTGQLTAYSVEWIGQAMAAAPALDEVLATAQEQQRLVFWYVPALEGQHDILTHLLHRYMITGPLSDPDLVALLDQAFVSLQLPAGGELAARFGLSAPEVLEPALLVLDGEGTVLHRADRLSSFDADVLRAWLVALRREHAPDSGGPELAAARERHDAAPDDPAARRELAHALATLGDHAEALELLDHDDLADDDQAALERARIHRLTRDGDAALAELDALITRLTPPAPEPGALPVPPEPGPALLGEALVERGRLQLHRGELLAARDDLRLSMVTHAEGARAAEAGYLMGVTRWLLRREDLAVATWQHTLAGHPGSLWAARAAACAVPGGDGYRGESPLTRGLSDPRWKHPDVYRPARDSSWRRTPAERDDILDRALDVLVRGQRSDGRWPGPRWGGQGEAFDLGALGNMDLAIAAVAARALHTWRDRHPGAAAALRRAESLLLRETLVDRESTAWPYADAYRLVHFAGRLDELPEDQAAEVRAAMQGWVDALVAQQDELGGPFSHFTYTSTFVTAAAASSLRVAADAGLDVPERVFTRAAESLESARGPEGRFGYLMDHPFVGRSRLGAAARGPLCEEALTACGDDRRAVYAETVEDFLSAYGDSLEKARKANFHVPALDHTAGYFFFHDLLPACRVARASGDRAEALCDQLLARLCELPEWDGAFVDSGHSYGKAYGTAMALLCFAALEG